jgi:hypothetical protein
MQVLGWEGESELWARRLVPEKMSQKFYKSPFYLGSSEWQFPKGGEDCRPPGWRRQKGSVLNLKADRYREAPLRAQQSKGSQILAPSFHDFYLGQDSRQGEDTCDRTASITSCVFGSLFFA